MHRVHPHLSMNTLHFRTRAFFLSRVQGKKKARTRKKHTHTDMDIHTYIWGTYTHRQTDRETNRETHRETHICKQTHIHTYLPDSDPLKFLDGDRQNKKDEGVRKVHPTVISTVHPQMHCVQPHLSMSTFPHENREQGAHIHSRHTQGCRERETEMHITYKTI